MFWDEIQTQAPETLSTGIIKANNRKADPL